MMTMMTPSAPHPPSPPPIALGGGGGASGSVVMVSPIACPGSYSLYVCALLWMFVTLAGMVSVCPAARVLVDDRPFASAIRYQRSASPHAVAAMERSVSPV